MGYRDGQLCEEGEHETEEKTKQSKKDLSSNDQKLLN